MSDFITTCILAVSSNFANVMIIPSLLFGTMGFIFGLSAYDKIGKLEKRIKQLEQPEE